MTSLYFKQAQTATLLSILAATFSAGCATPLEVGDPWTIVYQDNYNYAQSVDKFNTWFWREDSVGTHTFNVTNVAKAGCTAATPCVKLTSQVDPTAVDYINAEMYNNSCAALPLSKREGIPAPKCEPSLPCARPTGQALDKRDGSWYGYPMACYACYAHYCSKPYPYRPEKNPGTAPAGVFDSWNTGNTGAVSLWKNPLYKTDKEPNWEWYRDLVFNVPYSATLNKALKISMGITAEGKAGGSRGWGLWNTTMSPTDIQMAWFMEVSTQDTSGGKVQNSVWLMTIGKSPDKGDKGICISVLDSSTDIYSYHRYEIEWQHNALTYFVDGEVVAQHTAYVPNRGLPFHNWADNRNYLTGKPANYPLFNAKTNYINAYMVQQANNPPSVTPPTGNAPTCISFTEIEKDIEKDIIASIIAWIIEHGLMPGPVIPPGS